MVRVLNEDLTRAPARYPVKHPETFALDVTFDLEELVEAGTFLRLPSPPPPPVTPGSPATSRHAPRRT